jgi:hypothetical protein
MKKLAAVLCLFVGIICRSDAQLNGDYGFNISETFGKSIGFYLDGDIVNGGNLSPFDLLVPMYANINIGVGSAVIHNPKTGLFTIRGQSEFSISGGTDSEYNTEFMPMYLNPLLPDTDYFYLSSAPTIINGKTYTDKTTRRPKMDVSGQINLIGDYDVGTYDEELVNIIKGAVTLKASKLDIENAFYDAVNVKVAGAVSLKNRTAKRFNSTLELWYNGWWVVDAPRSLRLDLNDITTSGSAIKGSAEVYGFYEDTDNAENSFFYPYAGDESKWWKYSVKGTRKNGIATLTLTGLGVIKGLKATIYINEATEEIIPNGKNAITLYGQTITY